MNREEYRAGLWKKEAKSGTKYCTGKLKIGDREYQVTLFNNDKKGNEKAPDFNLIVRDSINTKGKQESGLNELKIEPTKRIDDTEIYADFGQLDFTNEEIPF
jgi:hypothetical protein